MELDKPSMDQASLDIRVGVMSEGTLATTISIRGGVVVVQYTQILLGKSVEVSYSAKAATQFAEHLLNAVRVAGG